LPQLPGSRQNYRSAEPLFSGRQAGDDSVQDAVGNDDILESMKTGKTLYRGGLSVKLKQEGDKILIEELSENSSTSKAGLKKGDRIIAINDVELREPRDVIRIVGPYLSEHIVKVKIERDKEQQLVIDVPLDALK
jgi:S1-C subfamily serine protease